MKVMAKLTDGTEIELDRIVSINENSKTLLIKCKAMLIKADIEKIEKELTAKIGKNVVMLPPYVDDIIAVE